VSRSKLETLKTILTSEYWLIASLCGAYFFFFALNRGGVVVFIDASFIILLINVLYKEYRITSIPASYWVTLALFAYLLGSSTLFYPQVSHYRWMQFPLRMLCLVFAIHCLSQKRIQKWVTIIFYLVLSAVVGWQLGAFYIFNMKWGTFSNPHYIASIAMLSLPVMVYIVWVAKGWYKLIFIPIALLNLDLMLKIGSRPSIAALTIAVFFWLLFLIKDRRKWIGVSLICMFFIILHITKYHGLADRLIELIVNLPREDRVQIWTGTWELLKDNSTLAWIIGNGIGTFRDIWPQYAPLDEINEVFAHGFFFEVLYASGLVGLAVLTGGIIALFIFGLRSVRRISDTKINTLLKLIIVEFIAWMIHCGLTFPIYSKYSQYSLAFILGPFLVVLSSPANKQDRANVAHSAMEGD
jgi:hypothetical protein